MGSAVNHRKFKDIVSSESLTFCRAALWSLIVSRKRVEVKSEHACRWARALARNYLLSFPNDIHLAPTWGRISARIMAGHLRAAWRPIKSELTQGGR